MKRNDGDYNIQIHIHKKEFNINLNCTSLLGD